MKEYLQELLEIAKIQARVRNKRGGNFIITFSQPFAINFTFY